MPQGRRRTALRIVGEVLREPMMTLLLASGGSYLLLGDTAEALILLASAAFSVAVTVVQEARTEHVLEAFRDLSAPRAQVNKGGERMRIAGCNVVRDDLLILEQGDRVPADAVLLETHDLHVDKTLLIGEWISVHKFVQTAEKAAAPQRPGGDNRPFVYSGSMITMGSGLAEVTATGACSVIGKIDASLAALEPEAPRLRAETARIVRLGGAGGGMVAVLMVLLDGWPRGGWFDAMLAGITTGKSMQAEPGRAGAIRRTPAGR